MANGAKPRARTHLMNQATTPSATTNETRNPIATTTQLWPVIAKGASPASIAASWCGRIVFSKSYPVATHMVGIETKNENSSAAERDSPALWPAAMVAIEREVPGKTAESVWQAPIQIACGSV